MTVQQIQKALAQRKDLLAKMQFMGYWKWAGISFSLTMLPRNHEEQLKKVIVLQSNVNQITHLLNLQLGENYGLAFE